MNDYEKIGWPGWETVALIGRGSFGAVYEIQRDVLGEKEKAALKVISIPQSRNDIEELYNDGYDDESITETFKEHLKSIVAEYSLMRKLGDCGNVVKCDDVRYVQQDNGIGWDIFIKMELLTPLTKALPDQIPEKTVIKLAKDIGTALQACKRHDVIHRDIKPQNIFVSDSGEFKLGDFGIAKTVEKTMGGTKIGTYKYMAPEVYNNQPYGIAADIYSLGLMLYWMLNDRRMPFISAGTVKLTAGIEEEARLRRLSGEPLPAPAHGSRALQDVVLKACAYDVNSRYKTPDELLSALNDLSNPKTSPNPPREEPAPDLDVRTLIWITETEAATGCTKTVALAGVGQVNVTIPSGTTDGAVLRLMGSGKTDAATGVRGNAYIILKHRISKTADTPHSDAPGKNEVDKNLLTVVITTAEAKSGCRKTIARVGGETKALSIPAGCKDGQIVDSVKVYVHDFSTSIDKMDQLPNAVLEMYANSSTKIISGILFSFLGWMIFGMVTMLIPVMAGGLMVSMVVVIARGTKRSQTIEEAKRILRRRKALDKG